MTNLIIVSKKNIPITTSLKIAEKFGKLHKNILRDVESLDCSQDFRRLNFELSSYINSQNNQ